MDIFLQQIINGLVLGSMYALVALGYTMVYGIIHDAVLDLFPVFNQTFAGYLGVSPSPGIRALHGLLL